MISSLLELRDGVAPSDEMTMNVATSIAHGMVLTDRHGNIARNVEAIALSDFLSNAVRGRLGKLITEVCQVKPNIVQSLRAMHPQQNSSNPHLPKKNQNQAETSTEEGEESFDKAFSRLHDRAAAAVRELDTVELECSKLLEKTPDRKDEVRKLLALCQATVSSFERAKNPGQQLPKPPPPSSSSSSSSTPLDGSDLPPPSPLKRAVSFAPGEMLILQRGKDEGFRTVRVVELIGSETYVVEHEIETTASHITLLAGEEEPIKPGSKVVYKKKNEATIIQVGSADTFDEEGRPSYLVAVRTYTDASRLSRDHPEN
jgi:hypothetical protein